MGPGRMQCDMTEILYNPSQLGLILKLGSDCLEDMHCSFRFLASTGTWVQALPRICGTNVPSAVLMGLGTSISDFSPKMYFWLKPIHQFPRSPDVQQTNKQTWLNQKLLPERQWLRGSCFTRSSGGLERKEAEWERLFWKPEPGVYSYLGAGLTYKGAE